MRTAKPAGACRCGCDATTDGQTAFVFTTVRENEGISALLLATHVFYSERLLRPKDRPRESISPKAVEIKAYSSAAQAMLLLLVIVVWLARTK
jgi:hypothetical protein